MSLGNLLLNRMLDPVHELKVRPLISRSVFGWSDSVSTQCEARKFQLAILVLYEIAKKLLKLTLAKSEVSTLKYGMWTSLSMEFGRNSSLETLDFSSLCESLQF